MDADCMSRGSNRFGFSCRFPTNRCNMLSTFCGSYAYAAPEILMAKSYDGKLADIWSLGIVLYAMVNGKLPFHDHDLKNLLEQTKQRLNFQPWVSKECADLIRKLLRQRPLTRLRMRDILNHTWLRMIKPIGRLENKEKLSDYDGIDTPDEEAELIQPKQSRDKSLKEPKLLLLANGETVRQYARKKRGKETWNKKIKNGVERKVIRNAERPQLQFEPERVCPCPANEHIIPAEREASKSDDVIDDDLFVYDDFEDDEPSSDETVTLIPVNRQTVRTWEVGTDKTTICYRLGTAPKSKPSETSANSPTLDLTPLQYQEGS
ncbi:putative serine/threonine-protein kinase MARK-A-like [Apostichopus japonicus]|uniref:Putative serine/threonine-protein kinase MARK-A-like n=1 Tax=Stichopus japonicus TaxID=307972 RepID=A0A2G8LJY3_STIJA|nr:putative serine/threonine-protein kinase MARK-A-like [Apostichopus japonicus]